MIKEFRFNLFVLGLIDGIKINNIVCDINWINIFMDKMIFLFVCFFLDIVGCVDLDICERECGSWFGCMNIVYFDFVIEVMLVGLRGLMLFVMMFVFILFLIFIFNSISIIFIIDIYKCIRIYVNDVEFMIVGRYGVNF